MPLFLRLRPIDSSSVEKIYNSFRVSPSSRIKLILCSELCMCVCACVLVFVGNKKNRLTKNACSIAHVKITKSIFSILRSIQICRAVVAITCINNPHRHQRSTFCVRAAYVHLCVFVNV